MRRHLLAVVLLTLPVAASAQHSVREFTEAQRASLQAFLSDNPAHQFIPETWFEEGTLHAARDEWGFGRDFKPYYQRGDFSGDGRMDFAVVLLNSGNRALSIVVFNQVPGETYRVAYLERVGAFHDALFINRDGRQLFYGVMETDTCGKFVSAGQGYIVEACN